MKKSTTKPASIPAPSGLSPAAVRWWRKLHGEYDLTDQAGLFLLETALRAFDRMNQAGELVDKHGPAIMDRYQQLKANPAVAAERDARSAMLGAFRALNIDVVPVQKTGRLTGR